MKINKPTHFLGARDCPFTLNGQNLTGMRRVKLREIAASLDLPNNGGRNEMLTAIISALRVREAPHELMDLRKR